MKSLLLKTLEVQAVQEGRKTMFRIPVSQHALWGVSTKTFIDDYCPYSIGDIIYVRETWTEDERGGPGYYYRADMPDQNIWKGYWKPSSTMPKAAARIFLEVVNVGVERLQEISEGDAIKEGAMYTDNGICDSWPKHITHEQAALTGGLKAGWSHVGETHPDKCLRSARSSFGNLWQSINGPDSWDANPFVWKIEFKMIDKPE